MQVELAKKLAGNESSFHYEINNLTTVSKRIFLSGGAIYWTTGG
jgi:hypothetical protein